MTDLTTSTGRRVRAQERSQIDVGHERRNCQHHDRLPGLEESHRHTQPCTGRYSNMTAHGNAARFPCTFVFSLKYAMTALKCWNSHNRIRIAPMTSQIEMNKTGKRETGKGNERVCAPREDTRNWSEIKRKERDTIRNVVSLVRQRLFLSITSMERAPPDGSPVWVNVMNSSSRWELRNNSESAVEQEARSSEADCVEHSAVKLMRPAKRKLSNLAN